MNLIDFKVLEQRTGEHVAPWMPPLSSCANLSHDDADHAWNHSTNLSGRVRGGGGSSVGVGQRHELRRRGGRRSSSCFGDHSPAASSGVAAAGSVDLLDPQQPWDVPHVWGVSLVPDAQQAPLRRPPPPVRSQRPRSRVRNTRTPSKSWSRTPHCTNRARCVTKHSANRKASDTATAAGSSAAPGRTCTKMRHQRSDKLTLHSQAASLLCKANHIVESTTQPGHLHCTLCSSTFVCDDHSVKRHITNDSHSKRICEKRMSLEQDRGPPTHHRDLLREGATTRRWREPG